MIDITPKTCHFCGLVDDGAKDVQWWAFHKYHGYISGLGCPACSDKFYLMTDDEHIAARVAIKLTEDSK